MMRRMLIPMVVLMIVGLVSCDKGEVEKASTGSMDKAESIKINFAMGNNARTLTYQMTSPLPMPDGQIISQGDLKPTWQYIEKELNFSILDNTVQDQKASEMMDIAAATGFSEDTIYGGNSIAERLMSYGAEGYFVNIKEHLGQMPNAKAYLEENPNVAKALTAYDGGIYHFPYAAELGNYARVFAGRPAWVMALLDSSDSLEDETHTLNVAYEGFWDRQATNVIDRQNAAASNGVLDRNTALKVLKEYISETYPQLEKPSDLFLGYTAIYDIDELVALWRCVELSPNTLSKVSTGHIVKDAEISPYYTRKSRYREDVLRLINYFAGQKVFSGDSYRARIYADNDGKLVYSYANENFLEKLVNIKNMYSEGLIHSEFTDLTVKDEFRKTMFFADAIEGQRQFGFMTNDWISSTTGGSDKINIMLPPLTTLPDAGISDFVHYMENTRAIKPDGWGISAQSSEEEINAALSLFDYIYSEEGSIIQMYSVPATRVVGGEYIGPSGGTYPLFNQWARDMADEFKNGDNSGFLRDFMGALLPIGFQKNLGFELQTTCDNGIKGWALYNDSEVLKTSYESDNSYMKLMPPVISLNSQNLAKLATTSVGEAQTDKIFMYITSTGKVTDTNEILNDYKEAGIDSYLAVYQSAYDSMMSN